MKKTKKILVVALALFLFTQLFCVVCACNATGSGEYEVLASEDEKFIFKAIRVDGDVSVYDAMVSLQKDGKLTFDGYTDDYGFWLSSVNGKRSDSASSSYWAVYTDLTEYDGVVYSSEEFGSFTYDGTVCGYANYGVSSLPVVAEYVYAFCYETY